MHVRRTLRGDTDTIPASAAVQSIIIYMCWFFVSWNIIHYAFHACLRLHECVSVISSALTSGREFIVVILTHSFDTVLIELSKLYLCRRERMQHFNYSPGIQKYSRWIVIQYQAAIFVPRRRELRQNFRIIIDGYRRVLSKNQINDGIRGEREWNKTINRFNGFLAFFYFSTLIRLSSEIVSMNSLSVSAIHHPTKEIIRKIFHSLHLTHFNIISRQRFRARIEKTKFRWLCANYYRIHETRSRFPCYTTLYQLDFANFIILFSSTLHYDNVLVFSAVVAAVAPSFTVQKSFLLFSCSVPFHCVFDVDPDDDNSGGAEERKFEFFIRFFCRCQPLLRSVLPCPVLCSIQIRANCVSAICDVLWMNEFGAG